MRPSLSSPFSDTGHFTPFQLDTISIGQYFSSRFHDDASFHEGFRWPRLRRGFHFLQVLSDFHFQLLILIRFSLIIATESFQFLRYCIFDRLHFISNSLRFFRLITNIFAMAPALFALFSARAFTFHFIFFAMFSHFLRLLPAPPSDISFLLRQLIFSAISLSCRMQPISFRHISIYISLFSFLFSLQITSNFFAFLHFAASSGFSLFFTRHWFRLSSWHFPASFHFTLAAASCQRSFQ